MCGRNASFDIERDALSPGIRAVRAGALDVSSHAITQRWYPASPGDLLSTRRRAAALMEAARDIPLARYIKREMNSDYSPRFSWWILLRPQTLLVLIAFHRSCAPRLHLNSRPRPQPRHLPSFTSALIPYKQASFCSPALHTQHHHDLCTRFTPCSPLWIHGPGGAVAGEQVRGQDDELRLEEQHRWCLVLWVFAFTIPHCRID